MIDAIRSKNELAATGGDSALATLAFVWRKHVAFFAMAKPYLLKTQGPLCANLRYWIDKGLTVADAEKIFHRLCDPDVSKNHKFESDLMTDLAGLVDEALRRRRLIHEHNQRRKAESSPGSMAGHVVRLADSLKV